MVNNLTTCKGIYDYVEQKLARGDKYAFLVIPVENTFVLDYLKSKPKFLIEELPDQLFRVCLR